MMGSADQATAAVDLLGMLYGGDAACYMLLPVKACMYCVWHDQNADRLQ